MDSGLLGQHCGDVCEEACCDRDQRAGIDVQNYQHAVNEETHPCPYSRAENESRQTFHDIPFLHKLTPIESKATFLGVGVGVGRGLFWQEETKPPPR